VTVDLRETAGVLAMISALDSRKVYGEIDAQAWHAVIGDLRFDDCREAVIQHYRESSYSITPADVRSQVTAVRKARIGDRIAPLPPIDPSDTSSYQRWQQAWYRGVGDGLTEDEAQKVADHALGVTRQSLPEARRDINYDALARRVQ
jgi:hypothetical protein